MSDCTQKLIHISDHPLIKHKIGLLRRKETPTKDFWELANEVAMLLTYEATSDLTLMPVQIETPVCETTAMTLAGLDPVLVPIMRAGMGICDGVRRLMPQADVGHIGLYRNEQTLEPVEYYCKLPANCGERRVFLLDPMLATGNSACDAIRQLCEHGCKLENITFVCLVAAKQGMEKLWKTYPEVQIVAADYDDHPLNEHGYIVPGLGDAGDRIFGTK